MRSSTLLQGLLFGLARSASIRWSNGGSATGPADPNVASGCTYWVNDIAAGDSCDSLQSYFGITIAQLVSWNPSLSNTDCTGSLILGYSYCVDAPAVSTTRATTTRTTTTTRATTTTAATTTTKGGPTPIQSGLASNCNAFYLVEGGDSCYDITASFGNFTISDFYSWNPAVGSSCEGLQAGYYVCVGVRRQSITTTTSVTSTATTTATVTGPTPQQTGIISSCNDYHLVVSGNTCASIANDNDISLSNFYSWNPAVGSSCSSLWLGYYVCVGVLGSTNPTTTILKTSTRTSTTTTAGPSPTQTGIVSGCTSYIKAKTGDSCSSLLKGYYSYLTVAQFTEWNPAVGQNCKNLLAGYYYCVATAELGPQPGTISSCKKYHHVAEGDTCWSIQQDHGITAAQFNNWNPNVGSKCATLWVGYYVCVGV